MRIATAIASSLRDIPVDPATVVVGEIGLSGELRSVNQLDRRIMEVSRLGFRRIVIPTHAHLPHDLPSTIEIVRCATAAEAIGTALDRT